MRGQQLWVIGISDTVGNVITKIRYFWQQTPYIFYVWPSVHASQYGSR